MESKSRSKKMAKDFMVYSVGVIGSKLMTFILLPIYTYFIKDPAEYGYFDMCLTACFLLMPFVTLQMRDGAFRFLLETSDDERRSHIVTFVNKTLLKATVLTLVIGVIMWAVYPKPYMGWVVALLIVMSFYDVYVQTVRGLGDNRSFVMASIWCSVFIGVLSVALLYAGTGILGLFIANIVARIISIAIIDMKQSVVKKYFKPSLTDLRSTGREILRFSLPLLPVAVCWWFVGLSNRYFIKEYQGWDYSGIYGLASRLAAVVQAIATIFLQTWQENAIQQYDSPDRNRFFSRVFNGYIIAFAVIIVLYAVGAKLFYPLVFSDAYAKSLPYLYPLCIATMLYALAGFFEIVYQCEKQTNRLIPPLLIAPVVNVALNFALIGNMGVNGVILSYALTYAMIIVYRWVDTRKWVKVKLSPAALLSIVVLVAGILPFTTQMPLWTHIAAIAASIAVPFTSRDFRQEFARRIK